jgi:hypothetical protein
MDSTLALFILVFAGLFFFFILGGCVFNFCGIWSTLFLL